MTTLEVIQQGNDGYAAKAGGLLASIESWKTFFTLKLRLLIYSAAEQLSANLQGRDTTVQEAVTGSRLLIAHPKSL